MNLILLMIVGLCSAQSANCQEPEFTVHPNGLIYSDRTMAGLRRIVDSLNLRFKGCDFDATFVSRAQTLGHVVRMETGDVEGARRALADNISFEDFIERFPQALVDRNTLAVRHSYIGSKGALTVSYEILDPLLEWSFSLNDPKPSMQLKNLAGTWLFEYTAPSKYGKEKLKGIYFPSEFRRYELPKRFAEMIGYADCLVDTTTTKYKTELVEGRVALPKDWVGLDRRAQEALLDTMRSTQVVGFCSMDQGPRVHALNIALLSAETQHWGVFVKAHLDIMNDRFDRMSDGSYAMGGRNTYIRELEELNISVPTLLLGIIFRIDNPATNHYRGSIGRIGRALSESRVRADVESRILDIISDPDLDLYNRMVFYNLYLSCAERIEDASQRIAAMDQLAIATATLPEHIRTRLQSPKRKRQ
ncbi:MAG: hypothetical protein FGM33_09195 [Candidatus Kapabacteria bacterium]|nr:hypothetical protein [Candidatus Kapabacteria bacterium]